MKGEPNERGKPMTVQTSLRNLLQKPSLLVNTPRARKGGRGGGKEKEGEKEAKVFPATAQASKDTHQKEGLPAMTKASRDTQGRGKREEREKERKREGEREERKEGVPSYEQSSRDTPKKERGDPEYSIQENPRKQRSKERKGKGRGRRGTKLATGSNEP